MFVALGWMLLAGLPCPEGSPEQLAVHEMPAPVGRAAPVTVWTDRDEPYSRGDRARVYLSTDEPAHVTVFRVDTDGRLRVLFPREPWGETFIRDTRTFEIGVGPDGRSFTVDDFPGIGYVFAVASPRPFRYDDITRGDYWDYRAVDGGRLRGDPYVLLQDLADRITQGNDYDSSVSPYYVEDRYEYPRFVCYDCHAAASYDQWDPYERACSRFRLVVYDEPAGYPYRYGRGPDVVTAARLLGPRYVFRDAEPGRESISRVPRPAGGAERQADRGRTSRDLGGPGSVPVPRLLAPERRPAEPLRAVVDTPPARAPERRREAADREREGGRGDAPEGLRPSEGRRATPPKAPPRSTGEPELRRRKP